MPTPTARVRPKTAAPGARSRRNRPLSEPQRRAAPLVSDAGGLQVFARDRSDVQTLHRSRHDERVTGIQLEPRRRCDAVRGDVDEGETGYARFPRSASGG